MNHAKQPDREFSLLLDSPHAYRAHKNGVARARADGVAVQEAGRRGDLSADELAGALGVFRGARRAARGASRMAKRAGGVALQAHPLALSARAARFAGRGLAAATAPIRRRIFRAFFGKLTERRARLISWNARGSLRPNVAETRAARAWAIRYVKRRGILGKLVGTSLSGDTLGEPVTTALVTASIPVLVDLARRALRAAESQGAPADPRAVPPAPLAALEPPPQQRDSD